MIFVSTSYDKTTGFDNPASWLARIGFYTGILEKLALENTVIDIERIAYEGEVFRNGVRYCFIRQRSKRAYFPGHMHRVIKRMNPDIVMVHGLLFPLQVIQLRRTLGRSVKIICFHHAEKPYRFWRRMVQRLADRSIDAYVFAAKEMGMQWVNKGIIANGKKIHEVMEASSIFTAGNKQEARKALGITGSPVFLWVGRLNQNKDPITVVKAFIHFSKQFHLARLYMVYQSEDLLQEIRKMILDACAEQAIQLIGKIDHDQLGNWYNSADFFISGSHYEGSGVALCEAMSCGCIPIVTKILSFQKMTGNGCCGIMYEPGKPDDLVSALMQSNALDIATESSRVLRQFSAELSFEAIAKKIQKLAADLTQAG